LGAVSGQAQSGPDGASRTRRRADSATTLVGVGLAEGVDGVDPADVFFLTLLRSVACTSFAHEMAAVWADDIEVLRLMDPVDKADPKDLMTVAET
jgi:hypothetical protein